MRRLVPLAAALLLIAAPGARAEVIEVNRTDDPSPVVPYCQPSGSCSLREALSAAIVSGDDTEILVPAGNYALEVPFGQLEANGWSGGALTIRATGAGPANVTAAATQRVFRVTGDVTLEGLVIRGGAPGGGDPHGGGILAADPGPGVDLDLTLRDTVVEQNVTDAADADGGGIAMEDPGAVTIENSVIRDNRATRNGGGIFIPDGELTIVDSVLSGNDADPMTASASGAGGAIFATGVTFGPSATIARTLVSGNTAVARGPGDVGASGGGLLAGGPLSIADSTFAGNSATGDTGSASAGAVYYANAESLDAGQIRRTTFSGNSASIAGPGDAQGGAIVAFTPAVLENVTVSGNSASSGDPALGGGVRLAGSPALLDSVTLVGNSAATGPNLAGAVDASVQNTILGGCDDPVAAATASLDTGTSCGLPAGSLIGVDPLLGALAANGGPTQTRALLPGSPAIDAGTNAGCPATDQRGVPRPQGARCDIGAFEAVPPPPDPPVPPPPPPSPPPPPPPNEPPVIRDLKLSPRSFLAAARGASRVRYRLSEAATVTFTVERGTRGRRVGGRCVKPTRRNRGRRRCVRYVRVRGSFGDRGEAGRNSLRFSGRLRGRKLRPGRYRLVARARDEAGDRSKAKRAAFRIRAPRDR